MASWRGTTSQQAQDDLDGLLEPALGFARQQLDSHGEFYPYAVVVGRDGQQRMIAAGTGEELASPAHLITRLISALSEQRDDLRAVAVVADVRVPEIGSAAVRVILEHSEQVALTVLLPYRRRRLARAIDYGDLEVGAAAAFIWPAD